MALALANTGNPQSSTHGTCKERSLTSPRTKSASCGLVGHEARPQVLGCLREANMTGIGCQGRASGQHVGRGPFKPCKSVALISFSRNHASSKACAKAIASPLQRRNLSCTHALSVGTRRSWHQFYFRPEQAHTSFFSLSESELTLFVTVHRRGKTGIRELTTYYASSDAAGACGKP